MYPWPIVPPSCGIVESFKTLFFVFFLRGGGGSRRWGRTQVGARAHPGFFSYYICLIFVVGLPSKTLGSHFPL